MWTRSHTITTKHATKEQMWRLFSDVNNWNRWDDGLEYTRMEGPFEKGNHFVLKPKGGPKVKVQLLEVKPYSNFLDVTIFLLAKMYDNHTFEETPGGLKITNTLTVKGPLAFLWVKLVAKNMAEAQPADMQRQVSVAAGL